MFERSNAFVALPGGIGTLEELIEMLTWAQLGRHNHPIIIANLNGFWDPLIELLDHMIQQQFVRSSIRRFYGVVDNVEDILPRIEARSEEHTSELQSLMRISYAVFCLKKKKKSNNIYMYTVLTQQKSITLKQKN